MRKLNYTLTVLSRSGCFIRVALSANWISPERPLLGLQLNCSQFLGDWALSIHVTVGLSVTFNNCPCSYCLFSGRWINRLTCDGVSWQFKPTFTLNTHSRRVRMLLSQLAISSSCACGQAAVSLVLLAWFFEMAVSMWSLPVTFCCK